MAVRGALRPSDGFVSMYVAARWLAARNDAAALYNDALFSAQVARFEPTIYDVFWWNPPTMGLLALPVAWLPYFGARLCWNLLSVAALVAIAVVVRPHPPIRALAWLGLVAVAQPVLTNLHHGQAYLLLAAVLGILFAAGEHRRDTLVGLALGLLVVTKTWGLPFLALLVVERRWKALLATLTTIAACIAATMPWTYAAWVPYLHGVVTLPSDPAIAVTAYQTVPGVFAHLFHGDPTWNPSPWTDAPIAARLLSVTVAILLSGPVLVAAARSPGRTSSLAAVALLSLVLSPVSIDYHYAMALVPIAALMRMATTRAEAVALSVGIVLVAAKLPTAGEWVGLASIVAYPKLAGGLVLLGLATWRAFRSEAVDPSALAA